MTYWVQIEMPVKGNFTNATQLDLDMVKMVEFARDGEAVVEVAINYDGKIYPPMKGDQARSFYEKWMRYLGVEEKPIFEADDPATPSTIHVPTPSMTLNSLTGIDHLPGKKKR